MQTDRKIPVCSESLACVRVASSSASLSNLQEELKQRLELQEQVVKAASAEARELLKRFDELKELKQHQEYQHLQQEIENR